MKGLERSTHQAADAAVEIRVEGLGRAVADVFIGSKLATPSAIKQLYCGVGPMSLPIGVERNFAEAWLITGVLAQFVAQPGNGLYQALYGWCTACVLGPVVIGVSYVTPPAVSFSDSISEAIVLVGRLTGNLITLRR